MARILTFTSQPGDWQALLSQPQKHWRRGYSARTLAHCWEAADGFPPELVRAINASRQPALDQLQPVLAIPEFQVSLPGGDRPSQNDIFVLAKSVAGPVVIMVEGKVNEPFGPTLEEWQAESSPGKATRLEFLLRTNGLNSPLPTAIRYQLLHRVASALITAAQYRAGAALLVVHSFSAVRAGWEDYRSFLRLFGVDAELSEVQMLKASGPTPLFSVWVEGDRVFLDK